MPYGTREKLHGVNTLSSLKDRHIASLNKFVRLFIQTKDYSYDKHAEFLGK
jgi:hypothetical protein